MPTNSTNIHKALAKIQQELKAPKGQFNKFANFNYRSCEDILEALKPLLGNYVILLRDEITQYGSESTLRFYVRATVEFTDGKESISVTALARESLTKKGMDESQITGTASSYARKYALNGLFAIDDTKDADTMDNRKTEKAPAKASQRQTQAKGGVVASPAQITLINRLKTKGQVKKSIIAEELTMEEAKSVISVGIKKKAK